MPEDRRETLDHLTGRLDEEPPGPSRAAVWREIQRIAAAAASEEPIPHAMGCTLRVAGDPFAALSPNLRLHHMERATRVAYWRGLTRIAWLATHRPRYPGRVRVEFLMRRARRVDTDNAMSACKALIDGLTPRRHLEPLEAAMLPSDSPTHVEFGPLRQERVPRGQEEVVITVVPLEEEVEDGDLRAQFR